MFVILPIHRRIKAYQNNGRFYARDNFAGFTPDRPEHAGAFLAYLSSAWFALYLEKNGHVAGGGALQVLLADLEKSPVPDFGRMARGAVDNLGKIWDRYCSDLDRRRLDDAVLEVLGYTKAQRSAMARQLETLISYRTGSTDAGASGAIGATADAGC